MSDFDENESYERSKYVSLDEFTSLCKILDDFTKKAKARPTSGDTLIVITRIFNTLGMTLEGGPEYESKWGRG